MGFTEFSETDALMSIQNGVYSYPNSHRHNLAFDKNSKLLIYDSSAHYLVQTPSALRQTATAASAVTAFHQYFLAANFSKALFGVSTGILSLSLFTTFTNYFERTRAIAQIHLIQHPANKDYSQEVLIVRADGEELQGRLTDLTVESNDENQCQVSFKGKRYTLRVNNVDVDLDTGRYVLADLLYATLNKHTEGIYIRGEPQKKADKKYWDRSKTEDQ